MRPRDQHLNRSTTNTGVCGVLSIVQKHHPHGPSKGWLSDKKISRDEVTLLEELTDSLEEGLAASVEEDEPESQTFLAQTFLERLSKGRIGPSTKQE